MLRAGEGRLTAEREQEIRQAARIANLMSSADVRALLAELSAVTAEREVMEQALEQIVAWGEEQTHFDGTVCAGCSAEEPKSITDHYDDCPGQAAAFARLALARVSVTTGEAGPPR
jgi:hypothetical protein